MPALSSTSPALNTPVPCGPVGWQNAIRNRSVPVRPSCGRVRVRGSQRSRPDHAPRRGCSSDRHRAAVLRVWHTASDTGSPEGLVVDLDVRGALFSARICGGAPPRLRWGRGGADEDLDDSRLHRRWAHGAAGVPAGVRLEPGAGSRADGFAVPRPSRGELARLGDPRGGRCASRGRRTRRWDR